MCRSQIRTVRSSGTRAPTEVYRAISWPNWPYLGIFRKTSPIETWTRSGNWPSTAPCVPLPLPGIPNRRIVRYFWKSAITGPRQWGVGG